MGARSDRSRSRSTNLILRCASRWPENFDAWVDAVQRCLDEAGPRLPKSVDRRALAEFVLTTMEGGVMQSRTQRDVGCFDRAVAQLRAYIGCLEAEALRASVPSPRARTRKHPRPSGRHS